MTLDAAPAGFLEGEVEGFGRRPEVLGAMVRLALDDPGAKATRYAREVRAPVLLIHGRRDALVGLVHARRLYAILARHGPGTGSGPAARRRTAMSSPPAALGRAPADGDRRWRVAGPVPRASHTTA
jgi:hypothetical protein